MTLQVESVPLRSGTTAEWAAGTAPILEVGELGIDLTTKDIRVGDGVTAFASLPVSSGIRRGRTTLVTGTKVVTDASITATSIILLTAQVLGTVTAPKPLAVTARSVGVSFTITSSDATDTSVVGYLIIEP